MTRHPHSAGSEPLENRCGRSSLLSTGEERRNGGVWRRGRTTLPHDITVLRRVPEIEFCHRSIVTRARQHSLRLYRRDSAMHSSSLNKLYHGPAGRTGVNRTVDTLLTFSRHPRQSTLKKTSRGCVMHLSDCELHGPHEVPFKTSYLKMLTNIKNVRAKAHSFINRYTSPILY